ncbi:unnamed protein product, partial [Pleuronectes platessa]
MRNDEDNVDLLDLLETETDCASVLSTSATLPDSAGSSSSCMTAEEATPPSLGAPASSACEIQLLTRLTKAMICIHRGLYHASLSSLRASSSKNYPKLSFCHTENPVPSNGPPSAPATDPAPRSKRKKPPQRGPPPPQKTLRRAARRVSGSVERRATGRLLPQLRLMPSGLTTITNDI